MRFFTSAILILLAIVLLCVICGFTLARKLRLKQAGYAVIISAAFIFRLFFGLGSQLSFDSVEYIGRNFIPFANALSVPEAISEYIPGIVSAFVFALSLGIFLPAIMNKKTAKGQLVATVCATLTVEVIITLSNIFGISYGSSYDTACILFAIAGCLLGYYIFTLIRKMRNGGAK